MENLAQKAERLKQLKELANHPGWQHMAEVMKNEIVLAAFSLAEKRKIDQYEVEFQRGAMWAARRTVELPANLIALLESELTMERAMEIAKSADLRTSATAEKE